MRRDAIVIRPYDPCWPDSFVEQCDRIEPVLRGWITRDIEHMGSTSVPGLPAKPIIDMLAIVDDIHGEPRVVERMLGVGWVHAPEPTDEPARELSFCFPNAELRTHHLHVVEQTSGGWRGWLAFRDHLRAHDDARDAYAALKFDLAVAHGQDPNDRDAYRLGKSDFIRAITEQALEP